MKLSRRGLLLGGLGAAALTGCSRTASLARHISESPSLPPQRGDEPHVAILNRFGFGPTVDDADRLRTTEAGHWFESQLNPDQDDPALLQAMVARLDIEQFSPWELRDWKPEAIIAQMQQKALLMATYSPWQVRERMVDFWTNHFSIYAVKGLAAYRKPLDERTVVRKHALGSFSDMLKASAKSTAMLLYLDQQNSTAAHPNENYGRELLELHTLGVHGGYTQKDVMEVARCFTGWTEERGFLKAKGKFAFVPELHDKGEKMVLDHVIPAGGGVEDGERVLEIVAKHPATARHIAHKLCAYFLGDRGKESEAEVADTFLSTGGDIKSMLKVVFRASQEGKSGPVLKRPFDYVVSSLRALGADTDGGMELQDHLRRMGQPLYQWPMPDGYPVATESWQGSILGRWHFAAALLEGHMGGTSVDAARQQKLRQTQSPAALAFHLPSTAAVARELDLLAAGLDLKRAVALMLVAPEFQWR